MAQQLPQLPGAEQLFEEMPCGLLVTAVDGTILKVNRTFCGWVGLESAELVGRVRLQELFTMGARIFHQTHWLPMLQMQGSISEVKFDVKGKAGDKLPMLFNVIRRTSEQGSYDEVSAIIAEERNKYEIELLAARKHADSLTLLEKNRALFAEQMIGIVSHDLRNPLSVVTLGTQALARSGELRSPQSERMLSHISQAAQRSKRLIDDLLDFTIASVGRGLKVTRQPSDLHQIAGRAVAELGVAFPGRILEHQREGEGLVEADTDRLTQLLGNLVGNAVTYGATGGTVTVRSAVSERLASLSVHNDGDPIPAELMEKMFEPMVRGDVVSRSTRSVGLGLFIVRAIATAHGGNVTVTSNAKDGTEFVLTLPR